MPIDVAVPAAEEAVPFVNPIELIKAQILVAKQAIAHGEAADVLDTLLSSIHQSIVALSDIGNPQCTSPLMQQFLSLADTKLERPISGASVIVMLRRLGYTPDFVKIHGKHLDPQSLEVMIEIIANDPLLYSDLKSSRMARDIALRSQGAATCNFLDKLLEQRNEKAGPNLLLAINEFLSHEDCRADLICELIIRHKAYLWTIPEFKQSNVGILGVGYLSPKAVVVLFNSGHQALAKEVAQVMCKEAHDANHFYYLAKAGAAPGAEYFVERFEKNNIYVQDVAYAIQNPDIPLPLSAITFRIDSMKLVQNIIERLPKLILETAEIETRLVEVVRVLSVTDNYKKQIVNSGLPKALLLQVVEIRDNLFSADLGV